MDRLDLLRHAWTCTYDKEDWYPPLKDALANLTAAQASWRPPGEAANTIWENVSHLLYYKERFLHRLKGTEFINTASTNDDTFTPAGGPDDDDAWQAAVSRLESVHRQIGELLAAVEDDALDRPLPTVPLDQSVLSLVLHDAFHTGQIVQIRKLQGSWPARRSFE